MDERYPIGDTESVAVAVIRHERAGRAYGEWTASIGLRSGEATVHVPGHYPGVLAQRLRLADERFAPGARASRDEYLDLTALVRDGGETLAVSSSARSPVRVTVEVPRGEIAELAGLLERAQELIEELRQGLGLVPDSLPDAL
jgi:non-canonical (house-cleaning) NTP pyrophosphatase